MAATRRVAATIASGHRARSPGGATVHGVFTDRPSRPVAADGYTMVELIIVVVVVGIITATVGTMLIRTTTTGGSAACQQSKDAASSATMTHYTMTGSFPSGFAAMLDSGALEFGPGVVVDRTSRWAMAEDWQMEFRAGSPPTFVCTLASD